MFATRVYVEISGFANDNGILVGSGIEQKKKNVSVTRFFGGPSRTECGIGDKGTLEWLAI